MISSASGSAHLIDFRRAPSEVAFAHTRDDLRGVLLEDLVVGRAVWISMEGLSFRDRPSHTRLLKGVAKFRRSLAGLNGAPHTGVLDWSTCKDVSTEALAGLPIVARALQEKGATLISCEPRDEAVARTLTESGVLPLLGTRWLGEDNASETSHLGHVRAQLLSRTRGFVRSKPLTAPRPIRRLRVFAPVTIVSPKDKNAAADQVGALCRLAGDEAAARGAGDELSSMLDAFSREIAANAVSRADARHVALAITLSGEYSPRLEVAISDDGVGIAAQIKNKLGVLALEDVPERYHVNEFLHGVQDRKALLQGVGRGFVHMLRDMLAASDAIVTIRSGGVLVRIGRDGTQMSVVASASNGFGTTVLLSVPLPSWRV